MESHNSKVDADVQSPDRELNNTNTMIWEAFSYANKVLWNEEWWLPPGIKWEDLKSTPEITYPEFWHLLTYPFLFAIFILIFKYCFILPVFLTPLARACGLRFRKPFVPPNAFLQSVYQEYKGKPSEKVIYESAKKLDCSERHIERWFRKRVANDRQTKYEKFLHCGLDLIDHFLITVFGVIVMYDKPYMYNLSLCWENYPHQNLEPDIWWYYMIGLGFYWAHLLTNCLQRGRKDKFWMILHHLCTIFLMVFSLR
ncbi:unnamed protein product [Meganyctiphanes norvegica]|uniref:TLC domain-containing protein n=1 Tax=Meganyctiphanes norvegica TaxID=48144 RepID=A0AAV2S154_MEGNR